MIEGIHPDAELASMQGQYMIARLALRQHVLEQAIRALYEFDAPKTPEERANAKASLELSLNDADDPGKVIAFAKDHQHEILPHSMK